VDGSIVTFDGAVTLPDGTVVPTSSTLHFRKREEFEATLVAAGFTVDEVRDAPDRPRLEFVFVASRIHGSDGDPCRISFITPPSRHDARPLCAEISCAIVSKVGVAPLRRHFRPVVPG